MPTVAELRAVIGLDDTQFNRGLQRASQTLEKTSRSLESLGAKMSLAITAPLIGLGLRAAKVAGDLEQSLNVLRATSGATGQQMAQLSKLAEQLGADIALPGVSAADAAQAMLELSKGGLSVADTMASARSVLQLAAAAQVDNARAAEITADALSSFGLEGKQAALVADLLAGAGKASTGSIDQMAQAMQQSGAAFREMGVNITDAATAIALMAKDGIKGSDAGTSLKTVLARLNPTTKEAKAAMDRLKISFFDAQGRFVGMQKSAEILNKALGKLSEQNRNAALNIIFGSDAMRAASILARAGADGFEKMRDKVSKAGSAAELAGAQNKGLKGALDALQSSIDTALNAAIKPFLGDLTNLAKKAAELAGKFGQLDQATQKSIVFGAAGAALAGPALIGLGALANALRALLPAFAAVRLAAITTWAAISGPLGPLYLAIVAIIAAIVLAWETNFGHIREVTAAVWGELKSLFMLGSDAVLGVFQTLGAALEGDWADTWANIKSTASKAFDFIQTALNPAKLVRRAAQEAKKGVEQAQKDVLKREAEGIAKQQQKNLETLAGSAVFFQPPTPKPPSMPRPRHDPNLFAGLGKTPKTPKKSPLQLQVEELAKATRIAEQELTLLGKGASELSIQTAKQFPLIEAGERSILVAKLAKIEAMRKEQSEAKAVNDTIEQMRVKLLAAAASTTRERLSIEVFKKSVKSLNAEQLKRLAVAEQIAEKTKQFEEQTRKGKEAQEAAKEAARKSNDVFRGTANAMSLMADKSLENKIALEKFDKPFRDLTDSMNRHIVIVAAATQRLEEWKQKMREATEAARGPLGNIFDLFQHIASFDPSAAMAAATKRWANAMTTVGERGASLRQEIDLLRDSSIENNLAWDLFGTSMANLDDEILLAIFDLGDLQRQIDATAAKKEALADLAQSTESAFSQAFMQLHDQGFGAFFQSVTQGFRQMLAQMAADFLAAKLTQTVMSAFPQAAQFLGKVGAGTAQTQAQTAAMAAQLATSFATGGATAAAQLATGVTSGGAAAAGAVGAAMTAGATANATAIGTSMTVGATTVSTSLLSAGLGAATTIAAQFLAAGAVVAAEIGAAMAAGQAAGGLAFAGGLAHGGPVTAGQSFLVGERGPELFIPSERGRIEPNGGGGGMRPIIVNVNVTTQDAASFRRSSAQIAETIGRSMESVQRRNG